MEDSSTGPKYMVKKTIVCDRGSHQHVFTIAGTDRNLTFLELLNDIPSQH